MQSSHTPWGNVAIARQADQILGIRFSKLPPTAELPPPEEWTPPSGWSLPSEWALPLFAFGAEGWVS